MADRRLGDYEILEKLGEGGMGEVYKARHARLNRLAAIKVLKKDATWTEEAKRRFALEAQTASGLNHPNIVTIYDIGTSGDTDFIAMEHIAGKTLEVLIPRRWKNLSECLKVAIQVADALSAAHAAGVIHRDLKPGNIMVGDDGRVRVLDFGLAKLSESEESIHDSETTVLPSKFSQTEKGAVLGTVAYMSPEQAEGKKIDTRSDIFSFGAVLYEMVTGRRAFQGKSSLSTLAAIVRDDPTPAHEVATGVPLELDRLIHRCLRKEPERRFQHMEDLKVELEELKEDQDSGHLASPEAPARRARWQVLAMWLLVPAVVIVIIAARWLNWQERLREPAAEAAPKVLPLTSLPGREKMPSFNPDGTQVAFAWTGGEAEDSNFDIYIKSIGPGEPLRLTDHPGLERCPAWSPDGRYVAFARNYDKSTVGILVVPALGGPERELVRGSGVRVGVSWSPDSKFLAMACVAGDFSAGLYSISLETGAMRRLTEPPERLTDMVPVFSPSGSSLVFWRWGSQASSLKLLSLDKSGNPIGEALSLAEDLEGFGGMTWLPNGHEILYSFASDFPHQKLWRIAVTGGSPRPVNLPGESIANPEMSRVGGRLAYTDSRSRVDIWRLKLSAPGIAEGDAQRLVSSSRMDWHPSHSPDGSEIAFMSNRAGPASIWIAAADGSKAREFPLDPKSEPFDMKWAPDGKRVAFTLGSEGGADIYTARSNGGDLLRLTSGSSRDSRPRWSADGKWIYFDSDREGHDAIYRIPAASGDVELVSGGEAACCPELSPDGRYVYFVKDTPGRGIGTEKPQLYRLSLAGGEAARVFPDVLADVGYAVVNEGVYYAAAADSGGASLRFFSLATQAPRDLMKWERILWGFSVSPDGRELLFAKRDQVSEDLVLVEGFH